MQTCRSCGADLEPQEGLSCCPFCDAINDSVFADDADLAPTVTDGEISWRVLHPTQSITRYEPA